MKKDVKLSMIKDEYVCLQKVVDSFDTKSLTIKTWCVTSSMAGIGAAFISHTPFLLLLASGSAVLFLIMEFYLKSFQLNHFARIQQIESFFSGEIQEIIPLQTTRSWRKEYADKRFHDLKKIFRMHNGYNILLYWSIFIIEVVIFVLNKFGFLTL